MDKGYTNPIYAHVSSFGNFINRTLKFVAAVYEGVIPDSGDTPGPYSPNDETDADFFNDVNTHIKDYIDAMEYANLRLGLQTVMLLSARGNLYLQVRVRFVCVLPTIVACLPSHPVERSQQSSSHFRPQALRPSCLTRCQSYLRPIRSYSPLHALHFGRNPCAAQCTSAYCAAYICKRRARGAQDWYSDAPIQAH